MRYYVEINGESSLDIQGLMIQSLPSISKPLMRSKQETIDGRDGDIITKLGYSAYDKTLKIGLWGNYDINEVIAFFNQEGTITFSNEPDKYYRFTILNRDDYVSQLDKFRTCTIALHCQPYKYKLNEEAEELENEYVEQEGTSLTFNNTLVAPMEIDLKGNTSQTGTPTPSSPIPINNVSGDNQIVISDGASDTTTYNIDLPEGMELNKIGTYQDYIYKENDKWYLHKEIGKKVFTNQSEWVQESLGGGSIRYRNNSYQTLFLTPPNNDTPAQALSNIGIVSATDTATGTGLGVALHPIGNFYTRQAGYDAIATIGITFYGILQTPTNTEITYTPLINQLDAILEAQSRKGTTNITQVNNDLPFIITASVLSGTDSITLTNEGNTTSKPTITITGSGVVGVYLENIQMFNISLGTNETIIIDTENMEAYYGSQLKNRQVTGDYSNFALQSGTNNLKFTGLVTNVEITNYNRWI